MNSALKGLPLAMIAALALAGCAKEGHYHDRNEDYADARQAAPLTLPGTRTRAATATSCRCLRRAAVFMLARVTLRRPCLRPCQPAPRWLPVMWRFEKPMQIAGWWWVLRPRWCGQSLSALPSSGDSRSRAVIAPLGLSRLPTPVCCCVRGCARVPARFAVIPQGSSTVCA